MLDCCVPLPVVKKEGINIYQFCCLAKCNGLDANMVQATPDVSLEHFRDVVRCITQREDEVLVCSYSREMLGQSGDGHFSPIGGYHAGRDLVLIFDVARFKYPPHWVTTEVLWKAMQCLDEQTGQPRGYFELKRTHKTGISTLFFKLSKNVELLLCCHKRKEIVNLTNTWWTWLGKDSKQEHADNEFLLKFVSTFVDLWCPHAHSENMQLLEIDGRCACIYSEKKSIISSLVRSLEDQQVYRHVKEYLESKECKIRTVSQLNRQCETGATLPDIKIAHLLGMILLSWPYQTLTGLSEESRKKQNTFQAWTYVSGALENAHESLQQEVEVLRAQFAAILCYCCSVDMSEASQTCC